MMLGSINKLQSQLMRALLILIFCSSSMVFSSANARSLSEATTQLCEKIKTCGQKAIAEQDIPPEMRQMMEGMFSGMCQSMVAPYVVSAQHAGLEKKAIACIESIETQTCTNLMENDGAETPECKELEAAAEKAYPEGDPTKQ